MSRRRGGGEKEEQQLLVKRDDFLYPVYVCVLFVFVLVYTMVRGNRGLKRLSVLALLRVPIQLGAKK